MRAAEGVWWKVREVSGHRTVDRTCYGDLQKRLVVRIRKACRHWFRGDGLATDVDVVEQRGNRIRLEREARPRKDLLILREYPSVDAQSDGA